MKTLIRIKKRVSLRPFLAFILLAAVLVNAAREACAEAPMYSMGTILLSRSEGIPAISLGGPSNGHLYFATFSNPSTLMKIRLSDFRKVDAFQLPPGALQSGIIVGDFLYLMMDRQIESGIRGHVLKIRLSDMQLTGTMPLTESALWTALVDNGKNFIYFGGRAAFIKIRVSDFTWDRSYRFLPSDGEMESGALDSQGFAYLAMKGLPGKVLKIRLSDMTPVGSLSTPQHGHFIEAALDETYGHLYLNGFETGSGSGVLKIRLSDFSTAGFLTVPDGLLRTSVVDPNRRYLYVGVGYLSGAVVRVRLSDFQILDRLAFPHPVEDPGCSVLDADNGHLYFGAWAGGEWAGAIAKVNVGPALNNPEGPRLDPPSDFQVETLNAFVPDLDEQAQIGYTVTKAGHLKIAIYDRRGRKIKTILDRDQSPGLYLAAWDGRNEEGTIVTPGTYFLVKEGDFNLDTEKVIVIR